MAFASADANGNPNARVWIRGTIANRTAAPCVNAGLFPLRPIARIMSRFPVAVPPKIVITNGIVANAGKWNDRLVGSITDGAWTACWSTGRKRIGRSASLFPAALS